MNNKVDAKPLLQVFTSVNLTDEYVINLITTRLNILIDPPSPDSPDSRVGRVMFILTTNEMVGIKRCFVVEGIFRCNNAR